MTTFADIVSQARVLLQDTGSVRFSDAELMVSANDAMRLIRRVRPDTFFGNYKTSISDYILADTFPVGVEFVQSVRDYIIAYANMRESEDAGTTQDFMGKFASGLKTL
jgi:glutamine cyclotransferase